MGQATDLMTAPDEIVSQHIDGPAVDVHSHREVEPSDNLALPPADDPGAIQPAATAGYFAASAPAEAPAVGDLAGNSSDDFEPAAYTADESNEAIEEAKAKDEQPNVGSTLAGIEQTRAEMGETLFALKQKLNPQIVIEHAKEQVREVAMEKVDDARDMVVDKMQDARAALTDMMSQARESAGPMMDRARDAASPVMDRAREMAGDAMEQVKSKPVMMAAVGLCCALLVVGLMRRRNA